MNRMIACGVALLGAAITSAPAFAQATDNANAAGSTTIVQPLTIANTSGLAFGRIVKPTTGTGTVAIANTADTVSAGAGAVALTGITTSRAKFTINGEGAQGITITVPSTLSLGNGTDTISVALSSDRPASDTLGGSLGSAGTRALNVGGSFSLPTAISTGNYTGTFNVTVAYN
jgi:hypothetical protein